MTTERGRAILVVMHPDLRKGQAKHAYPVTPRLIKDIADRYGDIVRSFVYVDSDAADDSMFRNDWEGAGFRLCHVLKNRIRADRKTTVVRAPLILSSMPQHVIEDAAAFGAKAVVIVATHEVPPYLFASLRGMGVKTILLAPDPDARIRGLADVSLFLRDYANANGKMLPGLPDDGNADAIAVGRYVASPDFSRRPTDAFERLTRDDPETAELLGRVLGANAAKKDFLLTKLRSLAEGSGLPRILLSALLILASAPCDPDADAHLRKNALYARLLALDIDVDAVGRLALDLLAEKGVLEAIPFTGHDVEYRFVRHPDHASHALARSFCGSMVPDRNRIAFTDGNAKYADEVAQALEIFCVDPADLTPEAADDIRDFLLLHLKYGGPGAIADAYARRGIRSAKEANRFEQRAREILGCPAAPLRDDRSRTDDGEPSTERVSVCTADRDGNAAPKRNIA